MKRDEFDNEPTFKEQVRDFPSYVSFFVTWVGGLYLATALLPVVYIYRKVKGIKP